MNTQQPDAQAATGGQLTGVEVARSRREGLAPWLAWGIWLISTALIATALILPFVNNPASFAANLLDNIIGAPALIAYATVGAIIASRRPRNPIGWLFSGTALLVAIGVAAEEYARFTLLDRPGSLPGGLVAAWLSAWMQNMGFFLMFTFLLLLFPNGRLPSRNWRIPAWLVAAAILVEALFDAFKQGPVTQSLQVDNPLGVDFVTELAINFSDVILLVAILACLASVVVRFRSSKGDERQQLKLFAYAAALAFAQFFLRLVLSILIPNPDSLAPITDAMLLFSIATFPIAAGIAILKYRLYDIDLLVNRTLVYVPLTAILAGVYAASLGFLQKFFLAATGEQSDAAIVITTLILVASSTPIKNGLQGLVDKRFKEAPDPAKKLHNFSDQVLSFVQLNSSDRLTRRLLDEAMSAFGAGGGAVFIGQPPHLEIGYASEDWNGDAHISVAPTTPGEKLALLSLGARRNHQEYTPKDREALQDIVDAVSQALVLNERLEDQPPADFARAIADTARVPTTN